MTNIFISYRREDCPAHAGRLYDTLNALFGEQNVFMDVDTIGLGEDFVETIQQAVGACDVVLVLIGDEWLNVKDRAGTRRIDSPEDFVRLEVATALARDDVRVIPVLVEGAEMPNSTQLPEALAPLARRNGISLMDAQWRAGTSILVQAIEPAVARPQASAPRDAPARPGADVPGLPATASSRSATVMWMIPALFGLAGASLIFAGTKTRERRWLTAGIVYLVLVLAGWIWSLAHPEDHPLDWLFVGGWFVAWIVSSIHLFLIRPAYLAKVAAQYRSA